MGCDLLPSVTAKILLPSDAANHFGGGCPLCSQPEQNLIPRLDTDLNPVDAACGSQGLFHYVCASRTPAAGVCW